MRVWTSWRRSSALHELGPRSAQGAQGFYRTDPALPSVAPARAIRAAAHRPIWAIGRSHLDWHSRRGVEQLGSSLGS